MKVLKIDIDNGKPNIQQIKFVVKSFDLKIQDVKIHKTKKGYHVRLYFTEPQICDAEIVLFQALCGSDLKRETFNYLRVLTEKANWNILFSYKEDKNGKLLSKEVLDKRMTKALLKELK